MMRELGLFAGIGAFSLGLERAGLSRPSAFVEIDPFCQKVLRKHWPDVPCHDNVLTREFVEGEAEIITAGFPCQDISLAGTGAGLAGERSGLYREVVRAIRVVRPQYTILENVAALLSRGLGTVLGDLAEIGNDAEWHCIPASAVGAPHRRDRIWIIANPGGEQHESNRAPLSGAIAAELYGSFADSERDELWEQSGRSSGPGWEGAAEPGDYGAEWVMAYPHSERCNGIDALLQPRRSQQDCTEIARSSADVADANSDHRYGRSGDVQMGRQRSSEEVTGKYFDRRTQWSSEPAMGGGIDGPPVWLDRCIGWKLTYAESCRRSQALRQLWNRHVSQALWRSAGGLERLSQAEVLFSFVREYEGGTNAARLLVSGKEASEDFLRGLRERGIARSASCRSGHSKQRTGEHSDASQPMSRLLACDSEADWTEHSWEDATPRVALGVSSRVDRLRSLGNSLVPQIPEIIGRAILKSQSDRRS